MQDGSGFMVVANVWDGARDWLSRCGATDRYNGVAAPGDAALWQRAQVAYGRPTVPTTRVRVGLPDDVVPHLLVQAREAYDSDAGELLIDMDGVAEKLRGMGHTDVFIDQTGGGTATLYVGPQRTDEDGTVRYAAAAGPGRCAAPVWRAAYGDPGDFYIGLDDDGVTEPYTVTDGFSTDQVVRMVDAQVTETLAVIGARRKLRDTLASIVREVRGDTTGEGAVR